MASEVEQNSIPPYSSIVRRVQDSVHKARSAELKYLLGEGRMLLERHLARILNASISATARGCLDSGSRIFNLKLKISSLEENIQGFEKQSPTLKVLRSVAVREAVQIILMESGYPVEEGSVTLSFSLEDQGGLIEEGSLPEDEESP